MVGTAKVSSFWTKTKFRKRNVWHSGVAEKFNYLSRMSHLSVPTRTSTPSCSSSSMEVWKTFFPPHSPVYFGSLMDSMDFFIERFY